MPQRRSSDVESIRYSDIFPSAQKPGELRKEKSNGSTNARGAKASGHQAADSEANYGAFDLRESELLKKDSLLLNGKAEELLRKESLLVSNLESSELLKRKETIAESEYMKKESMHLRQSEFLLDPNLEHGLSDALGDLRFTELDGHSATTGGTAPEIELTEEAIENYFKALQQVAQNKAKVQIDDITEYSGESDMTSVIDQVPVRSKEETELKSMMSQLDHDSLVNIAKLKNSIEFAERLQQMGLMLPAEAMPTR